MNVAEAIETIDIKHLDKLFIGGAWVALRRTARSRWSRR